MLLNQKQRLVELVRLLEERQYVFKNDPKPITQSLKASKQSMTEKLESRAARIDAGREFAQSIASVDVRLNLTLFAIGALWCVLGFFGLFALMRSQTVNFFYVLVCLLGVNTLMFMLWFVLLLRKKPAPKLFSPNLLVRSKDPITQATVSLYAQQLKLSGMRWYLGKVSHGLWLATLTGMLFAILFLLIVRQYSFSWQSTLLTSDQLVWLVDTLKWLPERFGFSVPTQADVIASQKMSTAEFDGPLARKWAGLLIGSMLCYGILPRLMAWAVCAFMLARQRIALPLDEPYYKNLINQWSVTVVDTNDMPLEPIKTTPKPKVSDAPKLAVLLDTPGVDGGWADGTLSADWAYFHIANIDTRDDFELLEAQLKTLNPQLLVGMRIQSLPDRGTLRKLDRLANLAEGGVVVQLLCSDGGAEQADPKEVQLRYQQWHEALSERGIALVHLNL